MIIPFAPPRIDDKIIAEVVNTLKSGWITTGPKVKLLEEELQKYCNNKRTIAVNSATAGLELILRWFGVGAGDEVILPVYTYTATANVVIHCGAKPVFVDVNKDDFNINIAEVKKHITSKTKVIIPVDFAGLPVNYDELNLLVKETAKIFVAKTKEQKKLNRILVLSDAAHSLGAEYNGNKTGSLTDISVFSFHAVKNLTTAEGGAIALNLSEFDNDEIYKYLKIFSLHGQTKDAFSKIAGNSWEYDVQEAGYKANMPDILASIGLVELRRYEQETLKKRKYIFNRYNEAFQNKQWAELPITKTKTKQSSCHVYALRVKNIKEETRNKIIEKILNKKVAVNVHFKPLTEFSFYKKLGYRTDDYPVSFDNYQREISLPVFYDITDEHLDLVIETVTSSVNFRSLEL